MREVVGGGSEKGNCTLCYKFVLSSLSRTFLMLQLRLMETEKQQRLKNRHGIMISAKCLYCCSCEGCLILIANIKC